MIKKLEWLNNGCLKFGDGNESEVIARIREKVSEIYELPDDAAGFAAARAISLLRIGETGAADTKIDDPKERRFCEFLINEGAREDIAETAARAAARYVAEDYPQWKNGADDASRG